LSIEVLIIKEKQYTIIDLGAIVSFIMLNLIKGLRVKPKSKQRLYLITIANREPIKGTDNSWITKQTLLIVIEIGQHKETIIFDILLLKLYKIILR